MEPWAECNQSDDNEERIRHTIEFILSNKLASLNLNDKEEEIDQNIRKIDGGVDQKNCKINDKDLTHDDIRSVVSLKETVSETNETRAEESENLNDFCAPQEVSYLEDDGDELSITIPETDSESENESVDESIISLSETEEPPAESCENLDNFSAPQEVPCLKDLGDDLSIIVCKTDSESEDEHESSDESIISISESDDSLDTHHQLAALPEEISEQNDTTIDTSILSEKQVNVGVATDIRVPNLPTYDKSLPPYPLPSNQSTVDIVARAVQSFNLVEDCDINQNTRENARANTHQKKSGTTQLVGLVYLDLSKDVVKEFATAPTSNQVDNDETFKSRLDKFLGSPSKKRRLFTPNFFGDDIGNQIQNEITSDETVAHTNEVGTVGTNTRLLDTSPLPSPSPSPKVTDQTSFACLSTNVALSLMQKNILALNACAVAAKINEHMKSIKSTLITEPKNDLACRRHKHVIKYFKEYDLKFSFLKSLDQSTPKFMCHPDAIRFHGNFDESKEHLATVIFDILNHTVFNCAMKVGIQWNKKVTKISHCLNTTKGGNRRNSVIELSNFLIIKAHSLLVALAHEMCHAAAWLYSGEIGHGDVCKAWLLLVRQIFPEIPQIEDCGRLAHLYTYSCPLCEAKSQGSFEMKQKQDNVRCFYCYGPIQIGVVSSQQDDPIKKFINKKDLTEFALFIKKNYRSMMAITCHKKHSEIMNALSEQYNSQ